ncbi:LapA family protein [Nodularia harveyana UHCC-0300]|uniref:LapA family protein n=1 Tax=Nodularia harveyana UHCC-0300 TaxID=2974287 RepID=A0ABU5UBN1_9CYAN|nr:LapA family protein [Nodularia harveyana]MEA5580939.1 LapA family protein [Nodularia harveyana UHCC-0300]
MKTFIPILISLILALWVIAIAIISVQNATPVSLKFLTFQSIQIPVGLMLAFCAGIGLIAMAIIQPLWRIADSGDKPTFDDDAEFFVDDEDF